MDLNLNQQSLEHCLKQINNIGSTTYVNICDGTTHTVPWGSLGWIVAAFAIVLIITMVVIFFKSDDIDL